jgi:hypothetical protein
MDEPVSAVLQRRWDAFCQKHAVDNVDLRVDNVDGQMVLHIGIVMSEALRQFNDPDYLRHSLAEDGLQLLRYDVQGDSASLAVSALEASSR